MSYHDRYHECCAVINYTKIKKNTTIATTLMSILTPFSLMFSSLDFHSQSHCFPEKADRTQTSTIQQQHRFHVNCSCTILKIHQMEQRACERVLMLMETELCYPLTSAPIFKRAGSCLLRFDLLTPYTSGCSSHICKQRPAPFRELSIFCGTVQMNTLQVNCFLQ